MKRSVYFDYSATTPLDKRVLNKMLPYFSDVFGNANSQHGFGRNAACAVDKARDGIAAALNCAANELFFTSGGTESDNFALRGIVKANTGKRNKVVLSPIEHDAVLSCVKDLEKDGIKIEYLNVGKDGIVDLSSAEQIIDEDTLLVCCMYANNEVGTVQPIKELCRIAHGKGAFNFTDAVQAFPSMKIDVKDLGVDLLSVSAHKIHGPKGIGALYVKKGVKIDGIITGGRQENGKRGGTTNVPSVVGFSEAVEILEREREENNAYILSLKDRFIERVEREIPNARLNGDRERRVVGNANFAFLGIDGESLLFKLDLEGICASAGSACTAGSLEPSHVLISMGIEEEIAKSSIRFSFGKENTKDQIDYCVETLKKAIEELSAVPLFKGERIEKKV